MVIFTKFLSRRQIAVMPKKVELTLEVRVQVVKDSASGLSQRDLAQKYKCGKTQICNILKNKETVLKDWEENKSKGLKRKRKQRYEEVNDLVWEWYVKASARKLPINGPILQEKAREMASLLECDSFAASNGWLQSFRKRHDIVYPFLFGKHPDWSTNATIEWKKRAATLIAGYSPFDIYNFDETGLFFQAVPDKSLVEKQEMWRRGKMNQERLTVALCCNAAGDKEPPFVIWKSENPTFPEVLNSALIGIHWRTNKKAEMTSDFFQDWIEEFNAKMKKQKRKVILFVGNAACHPDAGPLSNVELKFLSRNTTTCLQPLDQGIIHDFKLDYRKELLRNVIARMDESSSAAELAKDTNILDAVRWIKTAWKQVKPECITKCFALCGLDINAVEDAAEIGSDEAEEELGQLCKSAAIEEVISSKDIEGFEVDDGDWEESLRRKATGQEEDSSDKENGREEDAVVEDFAPFPLHEALIALKRVKATFMTMRHSKERIEQILDSLGTAESELEYCILSKRQKIAS